MKTYFGSESIVAENNNNNNRGKISTSCKVCDYETLTKSRSYSTFIAAPFGNWIRPKGCISVTGTWTLEPRGNRLWSVVRTLRYDFKRRGWTNRLQLPNPGIVQGLERTSGNEVLSIAEVNKNDFRKLIEIVPESQSIELNLSCPNLGGKSLPWDSAGVFAKYRGTDREWCIAKVSPLVTPEQLEFLIDDLGFTQLHFSNTLPLGGDRGGLSGRVLRPYTLDLIRLVRENWGDSVTIIAGGGVDNFSAVYEYLKEGANHVSLGSVCFNPFKMRKILRKGKYDNEN